MATLSSFQTKPFFVCANCEQKQMFEHKLIQCLAFSLIDSNQTISDDFPIHSGWIAQEAQGP